MSRPMSGLDHETDVNGDCMPGCVACRLESLESALDCRRMGTLTFMLPDEDVAFRRAAQAERYAAVIREVGEGLRRKIKYGEIGEDLAEALDEVLVSLHNECSERGIDPWEEDAHE